jgi:transposase
MKDLAYVLHKAARKFISFSLYQYASYNILTVLLLGLWLLWWNWFWTVNQEGSIIYKENFLPCYSVELRYIECSFRRLIRRSGTFLLSLIGRKCGSLQQAVLRHRVLQRPPDLFCVFMARVRYSLEQLVFNYNCYVKTNSYKSRRRKFRRKFPDICPSGDKFPK